MLQTELVRQGGHPTVLWDDYWGIASVQSWQEAQEYVLQGWCSWEVAYNTAASPFLPFTNDTNSSLVATPYSEYNSQTGVCERGPPPASWEPPFAKPGQAVINGRVGNDRFGLPYAETHYELSGK